MILLHLTENLPLFRSIRDLNSHLIVINSNTALKLVTQRNTLCIEYNLFFFFLLVRWNTEAHLFHKYNMMVFMGEVKNNLSSGGGMELV